jgi:hypothetical protein
MVQITPQLDGSYLVPMGLRIGCAYLRAVGVSHPDVGAYRRPA